MGLTAKRTAGATAATIKERGRPAIVSILDGGTPSLLAPNLAVTHRPHSVRKTQVAAPSSGETSAPARSAVCFEIKLPCPHERLANPASSTHFSARIR